MLFDNYIAKLFARNRQQRQSEDPGREVEESKLIFSWSKPLQEGGFFFFFFDVALIPHRHAGAAHWLGSEEKACYTLTTGVCFHCWIGAWAERRRHAFSFPSWRQVGAWFLPWRLRTAQQQQLSQHLTRWGVFMPGAQAPMGVFKPPSLGVWKPAAQDLGDRSSLGPRLSGLLWGIHQACLTEFSQWLSFPWLNLRLPVPIEGLFFFF